MSAELNEVLARVLPIASAAFGSEVDEAQFAVWAWVLGDEDPAEVERAILDTVREPGRKFIPRAPEVLERIRGSVNDLALDDWELVRDAARELARVDGTWGDRSKVTTKAILVSERGWSVVEAMGGLMVLSRRSLADGFARREYLEHWRAKHRQAERQNLKLGGGDIPRIDGIGKER